MSSFVFRYDARAFLEPLSLPSSYSSPIKKTLGLRWLWHGTWQA